MRTLNVVVIDDHEIVRSGLSALLSREEDIHVAGMADSGEQGLALIDELRPDVALVDYSLPGMSGAEVCESIVERHPEIPVVMLTSYLDDAIIRVSLEAGARAYVYKDVEGKDLKRAIRTVAKGDSVLDPKVAGRVMQWANRQRSTRGKSLLSARETQVIRLLARGSTNRQIAETLSLSESTAKTYVRRILTKLGCERRSEAAALGAKWGLL